HARHRPRDRRRSRGGARGPARRAGRRARCRPAGGHRAAAAVPGRPAIARIRSFVAVLLPAALRRRLADEIDALRPLAPGVAWVGVDTLHITLKLLGGVKAAPLPDV